VPLPPENCFVPPDANRSRLFLSNKNHSFGDFPAGSRAAPVPFAGDFEYTPDSNSWSLQIVSKPRKDCLERAVLHANDFDPVILVSVPFQNDLNLPVCVNVSQI
jgi:hypothetical protein